MNEPFNRALHDLAKRKLPDYYFSGPTQWIAEAFNGSKWYSMCLICKADLLGIDWEEHGAMHLKEHNLLAFI